jgi:hypothetical protein
MLCRFTSILVLQDMAVWGSPGWFPVQLAFFNSQWALGEPSIHLDGRLEGCPPTFNRWHLWGRDNSNRAWNNWSISYVLDPCRCLPLSWCPVVFKLLLQIPFHCRTFGSVGVPSNCSPAILIQSRRGSGLRTIIHWSCSIRYIVLSSSYKVHVSFAYKLYFSLE